MNKRMNEFDDLSPKTERFHSVFSIDRTFVLLSVSLWLLHLFLLFRFLFDLIKTMSVGIHPRYSYWRRTLLRSGMERQRRCKRSLLPKVLQWTRYVSSHLVFDLFCRQKRFLWRRERKRLPLSPFWQLPFICRKSFGDKTHHKEKVLLFASLDFILLMSRKRKRSLY